MPTKKVGPKGQILIPSSIRDALGLRPGVEVIVDMKDNAVVITRPKIEGSYTEYYVTTRSEKLSRDIDIKKIIPEDVVERHVIH